MRYLTVIAAIETCYDRVTIDRLKPYARCLYAVACAGVTKSRNFVSVAPARASSEIEYSTSLGTYERNGAPYIRYFAVPAIFPFGYGIGHFVALDSNRTETV